MRPCAIAIALLVVAAAVAPGLAAGATVAPTAGAGGADGGAHFAVSVDGTNSPVVEGDALTVTAAVENTGNASGTQEVSLAVEGAGVHEEVASTAVELGPGEATTVELSWATGHGDGGNYTAAVATANDTARRDVRVLDSQNFTVAIAGTNSPVNETETLEVTARVENTGDDPEAVESRAVELTVGGEVRDATEVRLGGGENTTVTLTWATGDGDAGEYRAAVATANDSASTPVDVNPPEGADGDTGSASFAAASGVVTEHRGDVADVDVYLNATNTTTLTIGSEDLNYRVSVEVSDEDGDGTVTVLWNTHLAGTSEDETAAFGTAGDADLIASADRSIDSASQRIAGEAYPMNLSVGGEETDVGTLSLQDPASVERSISVARARGELSAEAAAETFGSPDLGFANGTVAVARGDWLVLRVEAAGIHGYVDGADDLAGDGTEGVSLSIVETSTGPNEEPDRVDVSAFATVPAGEDALTIAARATDERFEVGESYRATFEIGAENPYVDSTVARRASFAVVDGAVTVATSGGEVHVSDDPSASVSGTSTYADGTRLNVTLRSTGENVPNGQPFLRTTTTTIQNGTWRAEFDLSASVPDQRVSVEVRDPDTGDVLADADGIVVENAPPTVSIASNTVRNNTVRNNTVRLRADASDPDGSVASYEWRVDGEVVSTESSFDHTFATAGDHRVALTVTDDGGASTTATVTVESVNEPPTVAVDYSPSSPAAGDEVEFVAEASDPDGSVASYEWRVDGEVVSTERSLTLAFDEPGDHQITVTVTTNDSAVGSANVTVVVESANEPPTVSIASNTVRNNTVTFDGTNSTDPDGNITAYEWRVDGEVVSTEESFAHTFEEAGSHEVRLVVTDDEGATSTASTTVTVESAGSPEPVGTPGFGPAVGVAALGAAALLAGRWRP